MLGASWGTVQGRMEEGISQTVAQRVLDAMEEREAAKEKAAQEAQRPFLRATSVRALVEELHGFELRENENVLVCVPCSLYGKQASGPRPTGFFSCQQPFYELRRATGIHYAAPAHELAPDVDSVSAATQSAA